MIKSLLNLFDNTDHKETSSLKKSLKLNNPLDIIINPTSGLDIKELLKTPKDVKNIVRSFQHKVMPRPGSVVICDLVDIVEHSGIYIGDNKIVHLSGNGRIETVSPEEFIARLNGLNKSMFIEVSCCDGVAVGSEDVAQRAIAMIGGSRKHNLVLDNCHQFTSGCLSGNFENPDNFLLFLREEAKRVLGSNGWRAWER